MPGAEAAGQPEQNTGIRLDLSLTRPASATLVVELCKAAAEELRVGDGTPDG